MSSANRDHLIFLFRSACLLFPVLASLLWLVLSVQYLIVVVSLDMLPVLDLRGKAFVFIFRLKSN